jgi:hypothetical protein
MLDSLLRAFGASDGGKEESASPRREERMLARQREGSESFSRSSELLFRASTGRRCAGPRCSEALTRRWRMILYRPTGLAELKLVADSGFRAWPPRLPDQPVFYPVLTLEYARKIARDWNAGDEFSGYVGFVTRFEISEECARRYPVQVAGGSRHEEIWVPAGELAEFNRHIVGTIAVVESYPGAKFAGSIDAVTHLPTSLATHRR